MCNTWNLATQTLAQVEPFKPSGALHQASVINLGHCVLKKVEVTPWSGEQVTEPDWKKLYKDSKQLVKDFAEAHGEIKQAKEIKAAREAGALQQRKDWKR